MKLQNNFTTVEQGKRLLELGLPAWTADCYHDSIELPNTVVGSGTEYLRQKSPCWSVGRLIEIFNLCRVEDEGNFHIWFTKNSTIIDDVIFYLTNYKVDFSKLC